MKYYVYILYNPELAKYYTGISNDIIRRLNEHHSIHSSVNTTKKWEYFFLVHLEECDNRQIARNREKFWKSGYGRELRDKFMNNRIDMDP